MVVVAAVVVVEPFDAFVAPLFGAVIVAAAFGAVAEFAFEAFGLSNLVVVAAASFSFVVGDVEDP